MAPISAATNERTNQPPKNGGLKTGAGPLLLLLCPGNCLCGCGHLLKRTLGPLLNQCTRDITTEASETYTRSGLCKNNCQRGQKKISPSLRIRCAFCASPSKGDVWNKGASTVHKIVWLSCQTWICSLHEIARNGTWQIKEARISHLQLCIVTAISCCAVYTSLLLVTRGCRPLPKWQWRRNERERGRSCKRKSFTKHTENICVRMFEHGGTGLTCVFDTVCCDKRFYSEQRCMKPFLL